MNLNITEDDLHLLFKKYEDRSGKAYVNYIEFIRAVDPDSYQKPFETLTVHEQHMETKIENPVGSVSKYSKLIALIQNHVLTRRIRISESFKDFDKLRSYSIRKEDFLRGLTYMGLTFTEDEQDCLAIAYSDPKKQGNCRWKDFDRDIEKAFGESNLERTPTFVHQPEVNVPPFSVEDAHLNKQEEILLDRTLQTIAEHVRVRQPHVKPFFRDIDRLSSSTGFVTKPQFRRCLAYMTCELSDAEFNVICKKWAKKMPVFGIPLVDSKPSPEKFTYMREAGSSICYVSFLDEVDRRIEEMVKISSDFGEGISGPELVKPASPSKAVSSNQVKEDFDRLMMKIKIKAKTERIRVVDFLADFDHLRHGKITRNEFRRATKIIFDGLTDSDLSLLETRFEVPGEPDHVNYLKFSDAVESVFTKKGLEKNPTDEPGTFDVYSNGWLADPYEPTLTEEEHVILVSVMERLNERVKSRRVDALIYMEDYDFVNEGTITTNQFRSVLNSMNLSVTDKEMHVISKYFATNDLRTRVNYRKLAEYGKNQSQK